MDDIIPSGERRKYRMIICGRFNSPVSPLLPAFEFSVSFAGCSMKAI